MSARVTRPGRCDRRSPARSAAFTLIELLVVVALIAGLAAFLLGGTSVLGGGKAASLQSAQAMVANLLTVARTRAQASGQAVRVLVQVDPASTAEPLRYLRYLAVEELINAEWRPVTDLYLPDGVYVVPGNFATTPAGLFPDVNAAAWVKTDGSTLRSTIFQNGNIAPTTINSTQAEQWCYCSFAAAGTTSNVGNVVLAAGRKRQPGTFAVGESPVELENPETLRGLKVSSYGVFTFINDRTSF